MTRIEKETSLSAFVRRSGAQSEHLEHEDMETWDSEAEELYRFLRGGLCAK